jgi:hypothetical protein
MVALDPIAAQRLIHRHPRTWIGVRAMFRKGGFRKALTCDGTAPLICRRRVVKGVDSVATRFLLQPYGPPCEAPTRFVPPMENVSKHGLHNHCSQTRTCLAVASCNWNGAQGEPPAADAGGSSAEPPFPLPVPRRPWPRAHQWRHRAPRRTAGRVMVRVQRRPSLRPRVASRSVGVLLHPRSPVGQGSRARWPIHPMPSRANVLSGTRRPESFSEAAGGTGKTAR